MESESLQLEIWRKRVEKELGDVSFETLRTPLPEGFVLEPLYVAAPVAGHVATGRTALAPEASEPSEADDALIDLRAVPAQNAATLLARGLVALVALLRAGSPTRVRVQVPIGERMLAEIAKLRALRRLVARVFEAIADGDAAAVMPALVIHAFATRSAPAADLAGNLIGNSAAVFAAVTGGADLVSACAHSDAPEHRRLADNVVRLALHEAHLGKVGDPAAGSYALEALTEGICAAAWATFVVEVGR